MDTKDQDQGSTRQRRSYPKAWKRQIVEETLNGGESVSQIARRYDVNANQVFKWRRLYRQGKLELTVEQPAALLPIQVKRLPCTPVLSSEVPTGRIEIESFGGHRVVIYGDVPADTLRTVLEALR